MPVATPEDDDDVAADAGLDAARLVGRSLGKYRVEALLGTGGFASVYRAYDTELEIPVALKVLKPQFAGDTQFERRFRREAATAARLRHPNIVKIYAIGRDDDAVYFAMDYLASGLSDRLTATPILPEAVTIRLGIDVASAIGYAHREGVIHRDVKADNILFDHHGNAVVVDFGIARAMSGYARHTKTNLVVGTPQYFSPEQARGHALDGRSDVYALGVTLYRAATGVLPFTGDDWYEIARQHVEDRPARPRFHNASLSRQFERIILMCLEKAPDDRYASAEALVQALAALTPDQQATIAMRSTRASTDRPAATPFTPTAPGTPASVAPEPPTIARLRGRRRTAIGVAVGAAAVIIGYAAFAVERSGITRHPAPAPPVVAAPLLPGAPRADSDAARSDSERAAAVAAPPAPESGAGSSATVPGAAPSRETNAAPRSAHGRSTAAAGVLHEHTAPVHSRTPAPPPPVKRLYGTVAIHTAPVGATFTLRALADGHVVTGRTPLPKPLSLEAGAYAIEISNRFCASYLDTIQVVGGVPAPDVRIQLVCGR